MFNIQNPRYSIIARQVLEWTFHEVPPANKIIVGKQTNFDNYAEVLNAILENDGWRNTDVNSVPQWITDNIGNPLRPCVMHLIWVCIISSIRTPISEKCY